MKFSHRTIRCSKAGLTQEQALESLYTHPNFDPATMQVVAIRQAGQHWVAKLKVAEFPPSKNEGEEEGDAPAPKENAIEEAPDGPPAPPGDDEGPDSEGPDADGDGPGPDGPPKGDKKPGHPSEKSELSELLNLVHMIADSLGIGGDPGIPGAEDPSLPGPDSPPGDLDAPPVPHHGPPGGPPGPGGPGGPAGGPPEPPKPKLRPGDLPPGATPINTPAFASVRTAACEDCGHAECDGDCANCPECKQKQSHIVGKVASFTATEVTAMSIKEAKAELETLYGPHGYKVKQIREARNEANERVLHALLSVR